MPLARTNATPPPTTRNSSTCGASSGMLKTMAMQPRPITSDAAAIAPSREWTRLRAAWRTASPTRKPYPAASTARPAPNALSTSSESGLPRARVDCLAQRGHFCPTTVLTMQRAQIGSPQFEQVSRVSTSGWLTHAGTTGAESVAIAFSIYEETSITVRSTLGPLTWWPGAVWNRGTLETVAPGASVGTPGAPNFLKEAHRADGHVSNHLSCPDRRFGSGWIDLRALRGTGQPAPNRHRRRRGRRSAHADDRGRELPGIPDRHPGSRADGQDA